MLGSGRDKIDKPEQFANSLATCNQLQVTIRRVITYLFTRKKSHAHSYVCTFKILNLLDALPTIFVSVVQLDGLVVIGGDDSNTNAAVSTILYLIIAITAHS